MSCPTEFTLSVYADGELAEQEADRLAAHLESCADCGALFTAIEQENAILVEVLGEEEAAAVDLATASSASSWLWAAIAAGASAPAMLHLVWQAVPAMPTGLGWLGDLGWLDGVLALSRGLVELIAGGHDMLVSLIGFAATVFVVVGSLGAVTLRRRPLIGVGASMALALLVGLAVPTHVHAAEVRREEGGSVKVDASESIDDTVFLSGKTAIVAGVVEGDVFAAAERVEVTGVVRGNLYCAGETITVTGEVAGNLHAVGKDVEVDGKVGGSGFLAGQNVILTEGSDVAHGGYLVGKSVRAKGRIGRDLYFAGEKIEISGSVERSARGHARRFTVGSSGSVGGDVEVTVPAKDAVEIDDGAAVGGTTRIDIDAEEERSDFLHAGFYLAVVARALALLIIGLVIVTLFPSTLPRAPKSSVEVLRDMGVGFVVLFATPVAMVLIALTVIGIPISMVLGMVYGVLAYASTLAVAYFVALRLPAPGRVPVALRAAVCLLAILLLVKLPLVGPGLNFLVHIFGMGYLVMHLKDRYTASRVSTDRPTNPSEVLARDAE